jgi:hypothetical protein
VESPAGNNDPARPYEHDGKNGGDAEPRASAIAGYLSLHSNLRVLRERQSNVLAESAGIDTVADVTNRWLLVQPGPLPLEWSDAYAFVDAR